MSTSYTKERTINDSTNTLSTPRYYRTKLRCDEEKVVKMIHVYKDKYKLATGSRESTLQAVQRLPSGVEPQQYIVPFAADVLGVELPEVKRDFDELMGVCYDAAETLLLDQRQYEALDIFWQLRLHTKGWNGDVNDSLASDIRLVIKFLSDTHKPWND